MIVVVFLRDRFFCFFWRTLYLAHQHTTTNHKPQLGPPQGTYYLPRDFWPSSVNQKTISDFWDLNPGPNSLLAIVASLHHLPATSSRAIIIINSNLPAGALCELPRLFGGNSHSNAAFNFCPDQLGCVQLPRPVRVHRLPRKLGLCAAAPIVRVECGRGVG